ncbi:MAG: SDR family oxidoreductase [Burkholderiaceae bacterium]
MSKKNASPVTVITGAAGGIGLATIDLLAAEARSLHLVDVDADRLATAADRARKAGAGAVTVAVSSLESPAACAAALPANEAPIAAVIHLAGIFVAHKMDEAGREVFNRTMQANAINAYDLVAAAGPRIIDHGRIVFIASLAFNRGSPNHVSSSMAKGALVRLTRSLSKSLAPRGILVNALAPGIIETPMPADIIAQNGPEIRKTIPLGRFGQAPEVASVIQFLIGPGSTYITGQLINVDGGVVNG